MGKNLRQQRLGKGTPKYKVLSHKYVGKADYRLIPKDAEKGILKKIIDAPGRNTPLAIIKIGSKHVYQIPNQGAYVGEEIDFKNPGKGNILELGDIPEGNIIYNIELRPGDGGKICRSSGAFATLVTKEDNKIVILMPTKKKKIFSSRCRATIGKAASFGRISKPFRKAGNKFHYKRSMGKLHARTSGSSMNAVDHPFGGSTNPGRSKNVGRQMPPGTKVGNIAPRRTGKRKRK